MTTEIALIFVLSFICGAVAHDFITDFTPEFLLFLKVQRLRLRLRRAHARKRRKDP